MLMVLVAHHWQTIMTAYLSLFKCAKKTNVGKKWWENTISLCFVHCAGNAPQMAINLFAKSIRAKWIRSQFCGMGVGDKILSFSETWAMYPFLLIWPINETCTLYLGRISVWRFTLRLPDVKSDRFMCSPTSIVLTTRATKSKSQLLLQSRDVTNRLTICPLETSRLKNTRCFTRTNRFYNSTWTDEMYLLKAIPKSVWVWESIISTGYGYGSDCVDENT